MRFIWNSSFALLLVTGLLLGLALPFGKIATDNHVPPLLWAFTFSFGAAALLLAFQLLRGHRFTFNRHKLRYYVATAAISYAIPNFLIFTVMPKLGAGYTGIMYTLSPAVTLLLSILLGVRRPSALGIAGILIGFVGALMVAVTRGEIGQPAAPVWVALALAIPVLLATGNIYRTFDWPQGADPVELAIGSHFASAAMLLTGLFLFQGYISLAPLANLPAITLAQIIASAAMFAFYFRLQAVGGPVYLSQIGYIAAGVGLISGTFMGERYQWLTWAGAAVIVVGVVMTTRAQKT